MNNTRDAQVPINEIYLDSEFNCRQDTITPGSVRELAESIETYGLLQPIIVEPYNCPMGKYKYRIVAGHRRFTAVKALMWPTIQAKILLDASPTEAAIINLVENIERKDIDILQQAKAIDKIAKLGNTNGNIAKMLKQSNQWVDLRRKLLRLPEDIQLEAAIGTVKQTHIAHLYKLMDDGKTDELYETVRAIKDREFTAKTIKVRLESEETKRIQQKMATRQFRVMSDVFKVQDLCHDALQGQNLVSSTLAWVIGEITLYDLLLLVKYECDLCGVPWSIPPEYKPLPENVIEESIQHTLNISEG